jgi:septal ring factor EnvC (AmiA/AmiB activator)
LINGREKVDDILRKKLVLILGGFNILFLLIAIGQCNNAVVQKKLKEKEMFNRLTSEENMNRSSNEKTVLGDKLKKIEAELAEEKATLETTKKSLVQEQLVNQSLKNEIEKVSKLKEALEEDLKEALVKSKAVAPQKTKK